MLWFSQGSNVAECPTCEIELFTWVSPLSLYIICVFVMAFSILVLKAGIRFLDIIHFDFHKQHKCHVFSSFEIRFVLEGINLFLL